MDAAYLFLNGRYQKNDEQYIKSLDRKARGKPTLIAVDGGLSFLKKIKLPPDYYIGDGDSSPTISGRFLKQCTVISYNKDKDKTDTELALDFCLKNNLLNVSIFGWMEDNNELDHFIANLMLSFQKRYLRGNLNLRYLGSDKQVFPLSNNSLIIKNKKGQRLSIIPISRRIVLSLSGTRFKAQQLEIGRGQTHALRNVITARSAKIEITGNGCVIIG